MDYWKMQTFYAGPRIVESDLLVEEYEDWSRVRSPSRARRRMRNGHRQNVRRLSRPQQSAFHDKIRNVIYMHPVIAAKMRASLILQRDSSLLSKLGTVT